MTVHVGVAPPAELDRRSRLFEALSRVLPVVFEARDPLELRDLDAAIIFESGAAVQRPPGLPLLVVARGYAVGAAGSASVALTESAPSPLKGRRLDDSDAAEAIPLEIAPKETVVALSAAGPLWTRTTSTDGVVVDRVAIPPPALDERGELREHLRAGRFLALLPLVDFLRRAAPGGVEARLLRAAIVFDDPNLHAMSYGHIDFRDLVADARANGYHVVLATIPLDLRFASRKAAALVRANGQHLSLSIHGINHTHRELATVSNQAQALALVRRALDRVTRFERQYGIDIDRVMVPPHGAAGEPILRALALAGIEGACMQWPYWWLPESARQTEPLGWNPLDNVFGLPILPRYHLQEPRSELLFRAYLGQPIVLYGHHGDLAGGLDVLRDAAEFVETLGSVEWCSLSRISRSGFTTSRSGSLLRVRAFSTRVAFEVPDGCDDIIVEWIGAAEEPAVTRHGAVRGTQLDIAMTPEPVVAVSGLRPAATPPLAVARRIATEARDRLQPALRRLTRGAS
jgi:hypothetical protein